MKWTSDPFQLMEVASLAQPEVKKWIRRASFNKMLKLLKIYSKYVEKQAGGNFG